MVSTLKIRIIIPKEVSISSVAISVNILRNFKPVHRVLKKNLKVRFKRTSLLETDKVHAFRPANFWAILLLMP